MYEHGAHFYDLFDSEDPSSLRHADFVAGLIPESGAVLDLGSGTGRAAMRWAELGAQVACVEPSAAMRAVMLARLADDTRFDACVTLWPGLAQEVSLNRRFEVIAACHMLYLLSDDELPDVLTVAAAHLKPGGSFVGDLALDAGRQEHAKTQSRERQIGDLCYRRYTSAMRESPGLWRITWTHETHTLAGACLARIEEHFAVRTRTEAECRSVLESSGWHVDQIFDGYERRTWTDEHNASRFVFVATR
jgi:SAM-dependent methyltransferase